MLSANDENEHHHQVMSMPALVKTMLRLQLEELEWDKEERC
jgi:hypothetical protein